MRDRITRVLGWTKKRAWLLVLLLVLLPLSQHRIHGQILPDPCCPILSVGLGTIADLLRTVIGGPLDEIRGIQDEINRYQREVIWPQEAINRARALVGTVTGMVSQLRSLIHIDIQSATLPQPVRLERTLLSANPDSVGQVAGEYAAVYQSVPVPADAPLERRHLIDINDAIAMGAMKRAIQIDADTSDKIGVPGTRRPLAENAGHFAVAVDDDVVRPFHSRGYVGRVLDGIGDRVADAHGRRPSRAVGARDVAENHGAQHGCAGH